MFLRNFLLIVLFYVTLSFCETLLPYEISQKKLEEYPLPELQFGLDDLEPFIDGATVRAHYLGHHEAYRKKTNAFLKEWRSINATNKLASQSLYDVLENLDKVPSSLQRNIKNNVGGYVNHALYWSILSPNPNKHERMPGNILMKEIISNFGNYENFKSLFTSEALALFGSGYVWLVYNSTSVRLSIVSSTNQDCPLTNKLYPILVIDVWEHAYYIKHQFRRIEHLSDYWFLVSWEGVEALLEFWNKRSSSQNYLEKEL